MAKRIDLSGAWKVKVSQRIKKKKINYEIDCNLSQQGDLIIGELIYDLKRIDYTFKSELKKSRKAYINMNGQIRGNQIHLHYDNRRRKVNQFGSFVLDIKSPDELRGRFVGNGPESGGLITGRVRFRRV